MSGEETNHLARLPGYLILSRGHDAVVSFDAEGRLFHAFLDTKTYRIGLGGKIARVSAGGPDSHPTSYILSDAEREARFSDVRSFVTSMIESPNSFGSMNEFSVTGTDVAKELSKTLRHLDPEKLKEQWQVFRSIYGSVPILPPDCYGSLLIQVTTGCHYGQCSFCTLYWDRPFHIRKGSEIVEHVRSILRFQGVALPRWKSLFLGDANALIVPQKELEETLRTLKELTNEAGVPELSKSIYTFTDADRPRTVEEYASLRELGLKRVYIGLETGHWPLRSQMRKQGTEATLAQKVNHLKRAGIGVGLIVMAGLGGREAATDHIDSTVKLIRDFALDLSDIIYISPIRGNSDPPAPDWNSTVGSDPMTEDETWDQAYGLMKILKGVAGAKAPKIALYDIQRFVY